MTKEQFFCCTSSKRNSVSRQAAYLVLVEGKSNKEACELTECSQAALNVTVSRIRMRHYNICRAYLPVQKV